MEYKIIFSDYNCVSILVDKGAIHESPKLVNLFNDIHGMKPQVVLTGIDPQIFSHVLAYIKHRAACPKDSEEFAKTLINNMDSNTFFDVVKAADFLGITSLVDISTKFFKNLLNEDPEKIRKMYRFDNDLQYIDLNNHDKVYN